MKITASRRVHTPLFIARRCDLAYIVWLAMRSESFEFAYRLDEYLPPGIVVCDGRPMRLYGEPKR